MTTANRIHSAAGGARAVAGARAGDRARVPIGEGAAAVEAWFADAGLPAGVVDRCPHPGCSACRRRYPDAA
jgi:hypothetical protein